ncbi:hypothetical protein HOF92_04305 [bacterium]|nr:hypothetical protein [bacterium]
MHYSQRPFSYAICLWLMLTGSLHASGGFITIKTSEVPTFVFLVVLCGCILYYISQARKGGKLYVRKIPALNSVNEAVGRATEMGRACLYIPGIMDIDDIQTLAGLNILGSVSAKTSVYDCELKVPVTRSMVLTTAQDVVKEAYLRTGHPDTYNASNIQYLTDEQFAFAAGVNGIIVREKPAAILMLGTFYAESLLIAETGNHIGAIQIAGTAEPSQLPFFVAACDYVLIGEELFAASAYLSQDPMLLGSLKGQDVAKIMIMIAIVIAAVIELGIQFLGLPSALSIFQFM